MLASHADAEDAAQEAFVAAYRRLHTVRGRSSFKTWLLTIAWNAAINRRRSVKAMLKRIVMRLDSPSLRFGAASTTPEIDASCPGPNPEQQLAGSELRRHVREAIEGLAPRLRR